MYNLIIYYIQYQLKQIKIIMYDLKIKHLDLINNSCHTGAIDYMLQI